MKVQTAALLFSTVIFALFVLLGASLIKMTSLLDKAAQEIATAGASIGTAHSLNRNPSRLESARVLGAEISDLLERMKELVNHEQEQAILARLETEIASALLVRKGNSYAASTSRSTAAARSALV